MTAFFETPVMRTVARIEHPSRMQLSTYERVLEPSLFMGILCHTALAVSGEIFTCQMKYFSVDWTR
jgi:hypothetical protein